LSGHAQAAASFVSAAEAVGAGMPAEGGTDSTTRPPGTVRVTPGPAVGAGADAVVATTATTSGFLLRLTVQVS
jgi:hypothetical protein